MVSAVTSTSVPTKAAKKQGFALVGDKSNTPTST